MKYKIFSNSNSISPLPFSLYSIVVDEDSLPIRLIVSKISHPFSSFKINYALTLTLIINKTALIFLPIVSLQPNKCMIRLIPRFSHSNCFRIRIVLNSSSMKFPIHKIPFIPNFIFWPIEFPISSHVAFLPISNKVLAILI